MEKRIYSTKVPKKVDKSGCLKSPSFPYTVRQGPFIVRNSGGGTNRDDAGHICFITSGHLQFLVPFLMERQLCSIQASQYQRLYIMSLLLDWGAAEGPLLVRCSRGTYGEVGYFEKKKLSIPLGRVSFLLE